MEVITDWARQIAAYLIFETILCNLIQKKSYLKYVRLVMGIILILLLTEPVLKFLNQSENYQFHLSRYLVVGDSEDGAFLNEINEKKDTLVLLEVEKVVKKRIAEIAEGYKLMIRDARLVFNTEISGYGKLEEIQLVLETDNGSFASYGTDSPDAMRIRERLAEEFGTEKTKISITIY